MDSIPPQVRRRSLSGREFNVRQLRRLYEPEDETMTQSVEEEPQDSVRASLTPVAVPPKPPRTFAHDTYLKEVEEQTKSQSKKRRNSDAFLTEKEINDLFPPKIAVKKRNKRTVLPVIRFRNLFK